MTNKSFILKHWLTTIGIAPILIGLYVTLTKPVNNRFEFFTSYHLYILFGLLFSLPALLGYYLLFQMLIKIPLQDLAKKLILIGFAIISIAVTFWFIKGTMALELGIIYSIAAIISGFLFKL